ncbi:MAG: endonuclease V [Candidatus Pacearchaeota archaeon]
MLEEEARKRGIDIDALKREQLKLSKLVSKKDYMDFSALQSVAGIAESVDEKNKSIIVGIVVLNENLEEIESKFCHDKLNFPYIPGFRAYRELRPLIACYEKLENRPDVFFIRALGIDHPRGCGLASHFGIATDSCVISIADEPIKGFEIKENDVVLNGKVVGRLVQLVDFAKPIIVSVGHKISLDSAVSLTKKFGLGKYKYPYPIVAASKYVRKISKEIAS